MPAPPALGADDLAGLRGAFETAGYTAAGVFDLLGPVAQAGLGRGETVPALRRTAGGSPLETLVRLFLLARPVPEAAAAAALPLGPATAGGLLAREGGQVRARVDVRPYAADEGGPWWVVSDLGTGLDGHTRPLRVDHVLGIGGASTTLAQLTVRPPVGRALDVGTGCGVQALHLAQHAGYVVGTDVLPRALAMAKLTAGLSGIELELRRGDLLEPVNGESFDLIVSNPPFVIGAGAGAPDARYAYRDSGLPGDEVCRRLIERAPRHLTPGGWCQLLANWEHRRGEDWRERVASWVEGTGCDAWIVQRDVQDPADYVATWLRDSGEAGGPDYVAAYDRWLDAFERAGAEAVGFGWVALRAAGAARPTVRIEDWPHPVEMPLGDEVLGWAAREGWLREHAADGDLLAARLQVAADVVQELIGPPGAEDPAYVVLRRQRGMRRAVEPGTAATAVAGACDGTLPLGAIIDAVASLLDDDPAAVRAEVVPGVRRMVAEGFLAPA
jgi:methylase of polypeptide subunit release factors